MAAFIRGGADLTCGSGVEPYSLTVSDDWWYSMALVMGGRDGPTRYITRKLLFYELEVQTSVVRELYSSISVSFVSVYMHVYHSQAKLQPSCPRIQYRPLQWRLQSVLAARISN